MRHISKQRDVLKKFCFSLSGFLISITPIFSQSINLFISTEGSYNNSDTIEEAFNGNFSFKKSNSYKKIEFSPFDSNDYGVYGSDDWGKKALLPDSVLSQFDELFKQKTIATK